MKQEAKDFPKSDLPAPQDAGDTRHPAELVVKDAANTIKDSSKDAYASLSAIAEEGVERTKEYVRQAVDATKDTGHRVADSAKDMYQSAARKAEGAQAISREYVRHNPLLVVAVSIAFGAAVGCLIMMGRRQPTFRQRCVDEPLDSAREAMLAAIAPVAKRLHKGYDSARDGAGKAMERAHRFNTGHAVDSLSDQIGRVGNNLKFW